MYLGYLDRWSKGRFNWARLDQSGAGRSRTPTPMKAHPLQARGTRREALYPPLWRTGNIQVPKKGSVWWAGHRRKQAMWVVVGRGIKRDIGV